jgi:hypothetical protein
MIAKVWISVLAAGMLTALVALPSQARNTQYYLKIDEVKEDSRYKANVPDDIALYFAGQAHPATLQSLGDVIANPKGNSFGRPDEEACRWTMISALKELHARAVEAGGNAVIDIVSYYRKNVYSSPSLYECHAGALVAAVALKGVIVKLAK